MGVSIREKERGSGLWWVFVHHHGKRYSKLIGSRKAAREVKTELEKRLAEKDWNLEEIKSPALPTLKQYLAGWQKEDGSYQLGWLERRKDELKESTHESYNSIIENHLLPQFGNKPIDQIELSKVYDFITDLKNRRKIQTARNVKNCLSAIYQTAITIDRIVNANPTNFKLKKANQNVTEDEEEEILPFTREERTILEETLREHYPSYYPLVFAGFRLGTRIGELFGLKWRDVDLHEGIVNIRRQITRGKITTPKSKNSKRSIRMSPQLIELLQALKAKRIKERSLINIEHSTIEDEWVFCNRDGGLLNYGNFVNRVWNRAIEKALLSHRGTHAIRHTYATLRLSTGDPIAQVSKELGHSKPEITFRTYFKWMPKESRTDLSTLDETTNSEAFPHQTAPYTHPDDERAIKKARQSSLTH
jgi:integrase